MENTPSLRQRNTGSQLVTLHLLMISIVTVAMVMTAPTLSLSL